MVFLPDLLKIFFYGKPRRVRYNTPSLSLTSRLFSEQKPMETQPLSTLIVGGGMITYVQILPSLYHIQRKGIIGNISVCSSRARTVKALKEHEGLNKAFPGQDFTAFPSDTNDPDKSYPDTYKEVISKMEPYGLVVCALPDQLHFESIMFALEHDQHVMAVKPLVLTYKEGKTIEETARRRGLMVGIEYHKRFDDRSLIARRRYRNAEFGEFRTGQAHLVEPWNYRHSNFQNWCTTEHSDPFTYVACHYIDLVHFITGLLPVEVSVYGIKENWPNGKEGFLWSDGRVIWENGAVLSVMNGFGYPDDGPGGNSQGLYLFTQGNDKGGVINHSDQYRGVKQSMITKGSDPGDTFYNETNPDYFQLIYRGGEGLEPVGYGYRSVEYIVSQASRINSVSEGLSSSDALEKRQSLLAEYDKEGIMATPANSSFNELVIEAGRASILNNGQPYVIEYGESPCVKVKEF